MAPASRGNPVSVRTARHPATGHPAISARGPPQNRRPQHFRARVGTTPGRGNARPQIPGNRLTWPPDQAASSRRQDPRMETFR